MSMLPKYEAANGCDALEINGSRTISYNQQFPVRKVVSETIENVDLKALVPAAYYDVLVKAVRGQEMKGGLYSGGTPFAGYGADCAPYSLSVRNALIHGSTVDGIVELRADSEELAQYLAPVAERNGCHFFDAKGCEFNGIDHMHLSRKGHAQLAEKLAKLIPTLV